MTGTCGWCGKPARGYATIGDERFCHDGEDPTCYQLASWDRSLGKDGLDNIARHVLDHLQIDRPAKGVYRDADGILHWVEE